MNFSALRSKTVWFGIAQLAGSLGMALMSDGLTETAVLAFVSGVATIILRAVTDKPLSEK